MRTTIDINDQLLQQAKLRAAETNRSLTSVVEDALRHLLHKDPAARKKPRRPMPVDGSGGVLPGVDLDNTSSLLDRMDGLE
ncbi:MAG: type II toxin-antitoxin system VapB family antitoxin [Candidatus Hydrogenedentes bacterium]|nr:type II toxin-antitoxin system VapB family antitoxin [Candidatus Hydrogenedentota bacterium]